MPPLDHLVLPTASLDAARGRLTALGFTVAPEGRHPFGTANACVYFADDTFLEPLAVVHAEAIAANAETNRFVGFDAHYRRSVAEEGFSALVVGTSDADADHARFVEMGCSAGPMLSFSRPFVDSTGRSDVASFKLAFSQVSGLPDALLFSCERVGVPKVDRAALQAHRNGVRRIVGVVMVSETPDAVARRVADALGTTGTSGSVALCNADIRVMTGAAYRAETGLPAPVRDGLAAILFGVQDLSATLRWLDEGRIRATRLRSGGVAVAPAPGQGAAFIFQEL